MSELVPFLHEHWIAWRIVPALTLEQAAFLLAGDDPDRAGRARTTSEVAALRTALEMSVRTGDLAALELWGVDDYGDPESLDPSAPMRGRIDGRWTTARVADLAVWAGANGVEHHWPTPKAQEVAPPRDYSRYPDELRAAIEAFEAVRNDARALSGRHPKQALRAWLDANKADSLSETARERVASVANWEPKGGAPKTPGG